MAKEEKDLNNDQTVAGQDLTQPVTEEGVEEQTGVQDASTVLADGTSQDKPVPYERFKEANEAKKTAEQETQLLRDQMALVQAQQTQRSEQAGPVTTYEQAIKELGLESNDYLTEPERIQVFKRKEQLDFQRYQQQATVQANRSFITTHPDYGEVVGRPNPMTGTTMPSAEIVEILQRKPHLTAAALSSAEAAYQIVMDERTLKELTKKTKAFDEQQTQQQIDAKTSPMSASAAGGGTGAHFPLKTRADVAEIERRLAAGEFDKK